MSAFADSGCTKLAIGENIPKTGHNIDFPRSVISLINVLQ